MTGISPETSSRICAHMNDDHAHTCHAIVISSATSGRETGKVQHAKMTSVSMTGYSLSFVLCDGDACAMKEITIPFVPPLNSPDQVRPRLIDDHHRAIGRDLIEFFARRSPAFLQRSCLISKSDDPGALRSSF